MKLLEDDSAVLQRFRGDSKISTYLNVIVQRAFVDFCIQQSGKWHASAVAKRLGPAAVDLERMISREEQPREAAIPRVQASYPGLTREELEAMVAQLPSRQRRRPPLPIAAVADSLRDEEQADTLVVSRERRALSERAAAVVRRFLRSLDDNDRTMLQLTFESGMQISKIARILGVEQMPLYRRRKQLLHDLRRALERADITAADVEDLIGHIPEETDFGLRKHASGPSERYPAASAEEEVPSERT